MRQSILIMLTCLGLSASVFAATPTIDDVNRSVANNQLDTAKTQLEAVLKEQPTSYNALRYMVEIYNIQEAVDGQPDPKKYYYENRLNDVEHAKSTRRIWIFFKILLLISLIPLGYVLFARYRAKKEEQKIEEQKEITFRFALNEFTVRAINANQKIQERLVITTIAEDISRLEQCSAEVEEILSVLTDSTIVRGEIHMTDVDNSLTAIEDYLSRLTLWGVVK